MRAVALVCSLKPSPAKSSSELLAWQLLDALRKHDVTGDLVRVVDHDVRPGVEADMGDGDTWPGIRDKVRAADILIVATPTWMGHMSSVAQRVLERLDAELSETDDAGRPGMFGKVAIAAVVGNEDGAHKIVADLFQALNDTGFTIPAQGCTYWNGEAMKPGDYNDLDETPEATAATTATAARNAAHLANLLTERHIRRSPDRLALSPRAVGNSAVMDHSRVLVLEALQAFRERGYTPFNPPGHLQGRGVDPRVLDVVGEAGRDSAPTPW